jgi:hypothetical protein
MKMLIFGEPRQLSMMASLAKPRMISSKSGLDQGGFRASLEEGYERRGVLHDKETHGGKKSGSGRGKGEITPLPAKTATGSLRARLRASAPCFLTENLAYRTSVSWPRRLWRLQPRRGQPIVDVRGCLRLTSPTQKYLTISAGWQRLGLIFETLRLFRKPFFQGFSSEIRAAVVPRVPVVHLRKTT